MDIQKYILLTIDVEDWFQVENFKPWIPFETWDQRELRVEKNTHALLNLFDSVETDGKLEAIGQEAKNKHHGKQITDKGHTKKVQATFFVLGWLAEKLPHLVREIHSCGHEVASHGHNHNLCNEQSDAALKKELTDSKKLLEDITGSQVFGFRAPNFSINNNILKIIEECGYLYDSSYNSFSLHGRYGQISLNGSCKKGIAHKLSDNFYELPISNLNLRNPLRYLLSATNSKRNDENRFVLPWGGGAYFRLIPHRFFKHGVQSILKKDGAYGFYIHPWEIDPNQPKVRKASLNYKFRHYTNLNKTRSKLTSLLERFQSCRFIACREYLSQAGRPEC